MASQKKYQVIITADAATAMKVTEQFKQRMAEIKNEIAKTDATTKEGAKRIKQLTKELVALNSVETQNVTDTDRVKHAIDNLSTTSLSKLRAALGAAKRELGKTFADDPNLRKKQQDVKTLQAQIDKLTVSAHKQSNAWTTSLKNLAAYTIQFGVFSQVKSLISGVIKKNFEMSDSLANIRKVSGLLQQDIDRMAVSLSKIDTRTPVQELNKIAYAGAKLGIGDYGADALESFVKASNQVNVALKEDLGEEALTSLAKITEVMGLIPKMGVEQSMLKTGSAIFKLASTTTATSNKIVDFSNRLLAMGKTGALSTADILALGAAVDSMAMEPEVASTAFSKLITEIRQGTNLIEKDLGLAKGSLKELLVEGKGMEALQMIFHKMHDSGNVFALDSLFKDMGSDGSRLIKVMVTMADKVDMLDKVVKTSNDAFRDGMAVTQEYNIQQQTAQGILERANNMWNKAFVNPDGINSVKQLAIEWYDFSKALTESSYSQQAVSNSLSAMITTLKVLINLLPGILGFFAGQGLVKGLGTLWNIGKAVYAWAAAQKALNLSMSANVLGIVIGSLALLYTWFQKNANAAEDAARASGKFTMSLHDVYGSVGRATAELESYKKAIDDAKKGTKERQAAIDNFNDKFGSYLSKLITEKSTAQDIARAYNEAADAIERKVFAQAKEDDVNKYVAPKAAREAQLLYTYDQQSKKIGKQNANGSWLMGFADDNLAKHGLNYTINELIRRSGVTRGIKDEFQAASLVNSLRNTNGTPAKSYTWRGFQTTRLGGKQIRNFTTDYGDLEKWVAMAVAYLRQRSARQKSQNDVADKFKDFDKQPQTHNENPQGVTTAEQTDKDAIKKQKQEERDQKAAWRKDLQEKKTLADAVIDNVSNYYDRQINAKLSEALSLGMDKTEQELYVNPLKQKKDTAMSQVRLAIAGKTNNWADVKKSMAGDMVEKADKTGVNLSKGLLDDILKNNIDNLRKSMAQLGKNLGISMDSIISEIFAKSTKNEQDKLELQLQQMEARRKVSQEHDYTGAVKQSIYDDFNTMGYANPTAEETTVTKKVVNGKEVLDASAFKNRKKAIEDMYETARKNISKIYDIDVSTSEGRGLLMTVLFGDDPNGMAARIKASLKDTVEDWQSFYLKLIQYSDNYTEAEKKQYDDAKKIADQMWAVNKQNLESQERLRKMQNDSNLFGKRTNFWSNLGLKNLTADPEIELMKARMQAAADYYAFIEKNFRNQRLLDDAEKARQEAELNYVNQMATSMKNRLAQMQELVQPIEDFGAAVGSALAEMKHDAESANDAIKSALKSMLEAWGKMAINDVNTQMWKAINDAGAKRARKKAQPDIDAARANANANVTDFAGINWRNVGTEQNPLWVRWKDDHYEDKTGNPVYTAADGSPLQNPDGSTPQSSEPPHARSKRNRDDTSDGSTREAQGLAAQAGASVGDVVTGNSSLADAGAGIVMSGVDAALNTNAGGGSSKKADKEKKKQLKEEKKHQKELTKEAKKGQKDREKDTEKGVENITKTTKEGNKEQTESTKLEQKAMGTAVETGLTQTFQLKEKNNKDVAQSDADRTRAETTFSIAGAIGKCFEFLGPIAGPIAAAVVMSTLMGVLNWALSSAFSSKSKSNSSSGKGTKLVTGMLTYDSGNVQDLKPFVGDNGEMYWAREEDAPKSGVNLLTTPTATTINGQPSLVAEQGPELVVGRETTRAMMMNNPSLLKALVNYDQNYSGRNATRRAYDEGNVDEAVGNIVSDVPASDRAVADSVATNAAILQAVNSLLQRLSEPISAKIDMYGRGNLYDSMTKANQFMKGK